MGILDRLFGRTDERRLRQPRFAGMMYPADRRALRARVEALFEDAPAPPDERRPAAIIAPHGDYGVVGPVMAAAHRATAAASHVETVALFGSSRLVPFRGLAATGYDGFETPLGDVMIDRERLGRIARSESVRPLEPAFDPEASLEVQLPFLQVVFDDFKLLPLIIGDARVEEVADLLETLFEDPGALVIISANSSHDTPPARASELDDELQTAIEQFDAQAITRDHSLERVALGGLLEAASARNCRAATLSRNTAEDAATETVNGYGAFALYEDRSA